MAAPARPDGAVQLPLPLQLPAAPGFAGFIPDGNEALLGALEDWAVGHGEAFLYVHGAPGSGKSRLLQGAIEVAGQAGRRVACLPLDLPGLTPAVLNDLERLDALALDRIDSVAGDAAWELPLFSLYNRLRVAGRGLLVAGRLPPAELPLQLADLRSRLCAGLIYGVRPLDEAGCARLLHAGAAARGLTLDAAAVAYILARCPRDAGALLALLERLDRASLAARRAPTVPFIGRLLAGG